MSLHNLVKYVRSKSAVLKNWVKQTTTQDSVTQIIIQSFKNACLVMTALLLTRLMGQCCFARWSLSSVGVVCRPPGAWAVGRPTLHGGPVRLRPVRATPCLIYWRKDFQRGHTEDPIECCTICVCHDREEYFASQWNATAHDKRSVSD